MVVLPNPGEGVGGGGAKERGMEAGENRKEKGEE